jgi:hypothetical protein
MTARERIEALLASTQRLPLEPAPDEMDACQDYYFEAKAAGFPSRDAIRYAWLRVDSEREWAVAA